jgi:hypothetical protein
LDRIYPLFRNYYTIYPGLSDNQKCQEKVSLDCLDYIFCGGRFGRFLLGRGLDAKTSGVCRNNYKYLKNKSWLLILYLLPIIIADGLLYFTYNPNMPLSLMQKRISELPPGQVLIESRYYQPFVHYNGTILWVGVSDLSQIDNYLKEGKRVFMEKNAITTPYMLIVGNNYHITSLGKAGDSESRFLFAKYEFDLYGDNLELKTFKGKAAEDAGQPVIFYSNNFWQKLARPRIDYGDIGTWIWFLMINHRDPTGWTYIDVRGKSVDLPST